MFAYKPFASTPFAGGPQGEFNEPPGVSVSGSYGDVKYAKLVLSTGKVGTINDLINENVYWRALGGGGILSINDVKKQVLTGFGYSGTLNDMEKKYWESL